MEFSKKKPCYVCVVLMLVLILFFPIRNDGVRAAGEPINSFEKLKAAVEAAKEGEELILAPGDYIFTEAINISGKNISFKSQGPAVFKKASGYKKEFITIDDNAGLTLEEAITMDGGNIEDSSYGKLVAGLIHSKGKLVINGGTYKNAKARGGSYKAPIIVSGSEASLTLNGGSIESNDYSGSGTAYSAGAILLDNSATMVMNGGSISGNQAGNYEPYAGLLWSDSPGAGAILVRPSTSLTVNGGEVSGNKGWGGAILVGSGSPYDYERSATSESGLKPQAKSSLILNGGLFTNNHGVGGGAISGNGNVDIHIPVGSSVEIKENKAYQGGGIFVSDWAVDGIGLEKEIAKLPIETWSNYYMGKFTMEGGLISGNFAQNCGGGVNISSNQGHLLGGQILNNEAGDQGGGVYLTTIPYTMKVENAYIAENKADGWKGTISDGIMLPGESGGGIWFCPTGSASFYAEEGVAFFDNTAGSAGDDFWSSDKVSGHGYSVTMPDRFLGGSKALFYRDEDGNRYAEGQEPISIKNSTEALAVKSVVLDSKEVVKSLSKLFIMGNSASKGGGIGSNGNIVFGRVPGQDNPLKDIEVAKTWEKGLEGREIVVELRAKDGDTDWLIESFKLNKSNDYKYVVKGLPATVNGKNIEDLVYVKELDSSLYDVEVSKIEEIAPGKYSINIENKLKKKTIEISKEWKGTDPAQAPAIKVYLVKNGQKTDSFVELNKENGWKASFENLLVKDSLEGEENKYTFVEEGEKGGKIVLSGTTYKVVYEGNKIINEKEELPRKNIEVSKEWKGTDPAQAPAIKVYLVKNGQKTDSFVELNKENGWKASFENLLVKDSFEGEENKYTFVEEGEKGGKIVLSGTTYKVVYEGNKIINEKEELPRKNIEVSKEWKGTDPAQAPAIKVYLVKNGQKTDSFVELNKENGWKASFENLLVKDSFEGEENKYTFVEEGEKGGKIVLSGTTYKVVYEGNKIINEKEKPVVPKTGDLGLSLQITILTFAVAALLASILLKKRADMTGK
ncbi:Cna B-type domain-containing protein [Peptoniphilaceae bacterium SGI.131]